MVGASARLTARGSSRVEGPAPGTAGAGGAAAAMATVVIAAGAVAVMLAALPYKTFDLDRFFVPKELVLHATALLAAFALVARRRILELDRVDTFLVAFLALSAASALFASNPWLAERALAVSVSSAVLFWAARTAAGAGRRDALLGAFALAVVLASLTSLLQAYGVDTDYVSLNRAPGGTLGNRNFVAHVAAIGAPVVLLRALSARTRAGRMVGYLGAVVLAAALALSRSRAAWLALACCVVVAAVILAVRRGAWRGAGLGKQATRLVLAAGVGVAGAIWIPNTLNWRSDSPYLDSVLGVVNYREGSGRGRLIQYTNSGRMALAHPVLGVGTGNWSVWYPEYAARNDPSLNDAGMTANPWPSSDWVAMVAERGVPAAVFVLLALVGIAVGAGLAIGAARTAIGLLEPLALLCTLIVVLVTGAFDAVVLLPASALAAWGLMGTLAARSATRARFPMRGTRRALVIGAVLVGGGAAVARSAAQAVAMGVWDAGGRASRLAQAARLDPGSYRVQLRMAQLQAERGDCAGVRRYGERARALHPVAAEPRRLLRACGVRVPRR